jgi:hypothetical protein
MHHTTTFDRIVQLYDEERQLLDKGDYLTDDEQRQFADIRAELAKSWPQRRAEQVFEVSGPPRMISAPDPRSQRQVARGIAPLPRGGD